MWSLWFLLLSSLDVLILLLVLIQWRLPDGLPISVLRGHTAAVTAIAFSPRPGGVYQLLSWVLRLIVIMQLWLQIFTLSFSILCFFPLLWLWLKLVDHNRSVFIFPLHVTTLSFFFTISLTNFSTFVGSSLLHEFLLYTHCKILEFWVSSCKRLLFIYSTLLFLWGTCRNLGFISFF